MWKDANKRQQAAEALKYTAPDVSRLGCVDGIIPEPEGGTQADPQAALAMIQTAVQRALGEIQDLALETLLEERYQKFRNIAQFYTAENTATAMV